MELSEQIKGYIQDLAERTGKTEKEIVQLAVFELYQDRHKWLESPISDRIYFKDELPGDPLISFNEGGKSWNWIQYPAEKESRGMIGSRIKRLREAAGLSQADLAEKTGLKQGNIARIEAGKYSTGQDILTKIAQALGKRLDII